MHVHNGGCIINQKLAMSISTETAWDKGCGGRRQRKIIRIKSVNNVQWPQNAPDTEIIGLPLRYKLGDVRVLSVLTM